MTSAGFEVGQLKNSVCTLTTGPSVFCLNGNLGVRHKIDLSYSVGWVNIILYLHNTLA